MNYSISEKRFKYSLYVIYLIVFVIVISRPIAFFPDSEGYLDMHINRLPLYPLLLKSVQAVATESFSLIVIVLQALLGLYSVHYCVKVFKSNLNIHLIWYIILAVLLLAPYVYNHIIANRFLSEAIAYPLYLLVITRIINSFFTENRNYLLRTLPFLFLLLLTRSQFLFLIPISIFVLLYISYRKQSYKSNLGLFILLIIFPVLTSTADRIYHWYAHDHFVTTPWTGIHLLTPAMYVADKSDGHVFSSEKEKIFFDEIYNHLEQKKLNIHHIDSKEQDDTAYYISNYAAIANGTIYNEGKEMFATGLTENEKYIALDRLTKRMSLPLVIDNFGSWFRIYLKNFIHAFQNARYMVLFLILLCFSLVKLKKHTSNTIKFIAIGSLLTLSNAALVAIGMHTLKRFTFYNDWIIFLIIFALLDILIKNLSRNEY